MIYLFAVVLMALFLGRGPVFLGATLSAIFWNFLFIPPILTFHISKIEDGIMFILYFVVATITGILTTRSRYKQFELKSREEQIVSLYGLSKIISQSRTLDEILKRSIDYIEKIFQAQASVLLSNENDYLDEEKKFGNLEISNKEFGVALWSYKNKKSAGRFTETLPLSENQYFPLISPSGSVGVLAIRTKEEKNLRLDKEILLQTFSSQIGIAIERISLSQDQQKAELLKESERVYKILVNSVSHEFRTPLTLIQGATNMLLSIPEKESIKKPEKELLIEIQDASEKLNRLVENLLDISRLETGTLKLNLEWYDIGDVVSIVIRRLKKELAHHIVDIKIDENLPLVRIDFHLMEQAFTNILHNSSVYTKPGTRIKIRATVHDKNIQIIIEDNGPGFGNNDLGRLFEKFYQGENAQAKGVGLGLSIAKGLIEIHGGAIHAENVPEGGARFLITVPTTTFPFTLLQELR